MTTGGVARKVPTHPLAWVGFGLAVVALVLAWYGSLHAEKHIAGSQLREARGSAGMIADPGPWYARLGVRVEKAVFGDEVDRKVLAWTEQSEGARITLQVVAFVLPFVLGVTAALLGSSAMRRTELAGGRYAGSFQAVFAIMIGGFAAVIAACMIMSVWVWPHMLSIYTM